MRPMPPVFQPASGRSWLTIVYATAAVALAVAGAAVAASGGPSLGVLDSSLAASEDQFGSGPAPDGETGDGDEAGAAAGQPVDGAGGALPTTGWALSVPLFLGALILTIGMVVRRRAVNRVPRRSTPGS
jgi:hypothetical protein